MTVSQIHFWVMGKRYAIVVRKRRRKTGVSKKSRDDFLARKAEAVALIESRIEHWNTIYNYLFNRVTVRNQRSRWGSCSRKGNLNFSYKLIYLPLELVDYVVVHELCHLDEFNHSPAFWDLVARTVPDYRERKRKIQEYEVRLRD